MRYRPHLRLLRSAFGAGLLAASMLVPALSFARASREQTVRIGDFVLRYELVDRVRGRRGSAQLVFDATLENASRIDVGAVVVEATSLSAGAVVVQGRLEFAPLTARARAASSRALRVEKAPGPPLAAQGLRFEVTSAAPALEASAPAAGATGFSPSEWIVMGFEGSPAAAVERGFALACAGTGVALSAHRLADERLVLNPASDLPVNVACTLGWVGRGARTTHLAFRTGASQPPAFVRYDRAVTSKNNPLPDDFFTVADASTATGRRVQIPVPSADEGTRLIVGALFAGANKLDGFSPHGPIVLELSEPPDPRSLPEGPEASLDPLSPIALLDLTPGGPRHGERVPFATHVRSDRIANGPLEHVLFIYPAVQLRRGGRYGLVISRRLRSESARPFSLSLYLLAALADPEPGEDPRLAKLRPLVREVAAAAGALELPIFADDLAFVLRFSVGSLANVYDTPLAMREQVNALPPPVVRITAIKSASSSALAAVVEGSFEAPHWTDDVGLLARDAQGRPEIQGTASIPFVLALPRTATDTPAPVVFYQHGWPGTAAEVSTQAGQELAQAGFAVAGFTDSLNRAYGPNLQAQNQGIYLTLLRTQQLPGFWMETLGEQLVFLRALAELADLDVLPRGAPDGVPDLDLSKLLYAGVSGGATQGAMLLPYAPEIVAAHLAVGSGRLAETAIHQESENGSLILPLVGLAFPRLRPSELWASFHAFQMIFDWQEAQTHAARLYRDPIEVDGTVRKASILWTEGLDDGYSPPVARRAMAHAIGLSLLEPVREAVPILSVAPTPASANIDEVTTGGVFQYVPAGVAGIPPSLGCEGESEGHYCPQVARAAWLQRAYFFASALGEPPIIANPFSDADGDDLSDVDEVLRGTDPARSDSDGDGMPDGFEVSNRLDPRNSGDGDLDADGDGLLNRGEYQAGSNVNRSDTDRDGLMDGAEVHVHGTNPTLADTDGGGRSDGLEVTRDGTDPRVGSDDLPLRTLPARVRDGAGFFWAVAMDGGILTEDEEYHDDEVARDLVVGSSLFPLFEDARLEDEGELVLGSAELAGLGVTRKVFVSPSSGFTRHLVILDNGSATEIVAPVLIGHRTGIGIAETSSGDAILDASDDWLRSTGGEYEPILVIGFSDPLAALQPASNTSSSVRFEARVPAGSRAILLSFRSRHETSEGAHESIDRMVRLDESLFEGMSFEERADVVNYVALPDADRDGLADATDGDGFDGLTEQSLETER